MIVCKRVYDDALKEDGYRILVDRLWPRGIKKSDLLHDEWNKALAPSSALRKAFHSETIDFSKFTRLYREELMAQQVALHAVAARAREGNITLLYAAKNTAQNHARVLADVLKEIAS